MALNLKNESSAAPEWNNVDEASVWGITEHDWRTNLLGVGSYPVTIFLGIKISVILASLDIIIKNELCPSQIREESATNRQLKWPPNWTFLTLKEVKTLKCDCTFLLSRTIPIF